MTHFLCQAKWIALVEIQPVNDLTYDREDRASLEDEFLTRLKCSEGRGGGDILSWERLKVE